MDGDWLTVAGLVGVTLFVSVGKWLNEFRQWLVGFTVLTNPLRMLGELLTCTISVGFVVGAVWALSQSVSWPGVVVMGGFISLAAYITDEGLALMDAGVRKLMGARPSPMPPMALPAKPTEEHRPLTEEEAHAAVDARELTHE